MLLDPGMDLTLRPMKYPHFFDRFKDAIKNTWTVEEVDLHSDLADLARLSPAEQHLLFEEAVHVQFYLNLLDTYVPDEQERFAAFAAFENIPSIARKAEFCFTWIDSIYELRSLSSRADRRKFLLNLICFAACIEGLFF